MRSRRSDGLGARREAQGTRPDILKNRRRLNNLNANAIDTTSPPAELGDLFSAHNRTRWPVRLSFTNTSGKSHRINFQSVAGFVKDHHEVHGLPADANTSAALQIHLTTVGSDPYFAPHAACRY